MLRAAILAAMLLVLPASEAPARRRPQPQPGWSALILPHDRSRLRDWRETWLAALASARAGGAGARIDAAGSLLQPDAALPFPAAPNGDYRCRVTKLGARDGAGPIFLEVPSFTCRIVDGRLIQIDGIQRPSGRLLAFDGLRQVFLGALAIGDEAAALDYGRDSDRDMVGLFERIGPHRWRLVLPRPRWESLIDVVDLVPKG